jgi:hypothetical protein
VLPKNKTKEEEEERNHFLQAVIPPAFRRLRQEGNELGANVGYKARPYLNKKRERERRERKGEEGEGKEKGRRKEGRKEGRREGGREGSH